MSNIAQFIQSKLAKFNAENVLTFTLGVDDATTKVKRAMEKVNRNLDKVSALIDDVEVDKSKLKIEIPEALKKNSITNQIGFEGYDLTPDELNCLKAKSPAVFRGKSVLHQATANYYWGDGELAKQVTFAIEII